MLFEAPGSAVGVKLGRMKPARLIEYRILSTSRHAVVVSLLTDGLANTALLQLLRIETGVSRALSVYAVYREASMTFEASAKLVFERPGDSLDTIAHTLVRDPEFLGFMLTPVDRAVRRHFTHLGC